MVDHSSVTSFFLPSWGGSGLREMNVTGLKGVPFWRELKLGVYRRVYRVEDAQRQGTGVRLPHRSPFCFISRGGINCIAVDFTSPALALACLARRPSKSAVATQSGERERRRRTEQSELHRANIIGRAPPASGRRDSRVMGKLWLPQN